MVRLHVMNVRAAKATSKEDLLAKSMKWIDAELDECKKLGIVAVINFEIFPLSPGTKVHKDESEFWSSAANLDEVVEVAKTFATHFKGRGQELAAYDILSEPLIYVDGQARTPNGWVGLQTRIIQAIRQVDSQRWIVLAPGSGGGPDGYKDYLPPIEKRIVWGVHIYIPHSFTHQGIYSWPVGTEYPGKIHSDYWDKNLLKLAFQPVLNFQKQHPGPVWVGEFSAVRWAKGGEQYLRDVTDIFNGNQWGWSYFSGTGWHGWSPDFDNEFSSDQDFEKHRVGLKSERWKTLKEIFDRTK